MKDSMTPYPMSTLRLRGLHRPALEAHFLALDPEDRRLRFGAPVREAGVHDYVARIDFGRDCVFAVQGDDLSLHAVVHVARLPESAELGLSVLRGYRGAGFGNSLMQRAVTWLRNRTIPSVYVHCLTENGAMMHLARKNGMRIEHDGSETDAYLRLEGATAQSMADEWVEDQRAFALQAVRQQLRWMGMILGRA